MKIGMGERRKRVTYKHIKSNGDEKNEDLYQDYYS